MITGMYGAGNIGDDLILESALELLNRNFDNINISITSFSKDYLKTLYRNYHVFGVSINDKIKAVKNCDLLLVAGGTAFQDKTVSRFMQGVMYWYVEYLLLAKLFGKKIVFWGVGCDELTTKWGRGYARMLNMSDMIICRDERSIENLLPFVKRNKLKEGADPAYIFNKQKITARNKLIIEKLSFHKNIVIVNLRKTGLNNSYKEYIFNYIKHNPQNYYLFVNSEVRPGFDHPVVNEILKMFGSEAEDNIYYCGTDYFSPAELNQIINHADIVITMRLHFAILAALNNKKIFVISDSDKTSSFAKLNKVECWRLHKEISYSEFLEKIDNIKSCNDYALSVDSKFLMKDIRGYID